MNTFLPQGLLEIHFLRLYTFTPSVLLPHFSFMAYSLSEGPEEGGFQSHFPAHIFYKSHFPVLKKYLSHSHFDIFSHSQCPNPSPSALNPIFPGQQKANPSSHFTPSGPSYLPVPTHLSLPFRRSQLTRQIIQ